MAGGLKSRGLDLVIGNWPMKLTALGLSAVLWAAVATEKPASQRVPIRVQVNTPEGRPLTGPVPEVQGTFTGPARELLKLFASPPVIQVTIPDTTTDSTYTARIAAADVEVAGNVDVRAESVEPSIVSFFLENIAQRMIPVQPRVSVRLDSGFTTFGGIAVNPDSVLVIGPAPRLAALSQISTVPMELSGATASVRRAVRLDTNGLGPVRLTRQEVEISTEVGPISERVIMGVPVAVRGDLGSWSSSPPAVIVTVRGARGRLGRLTRDSIEVAAIPEGNGRPETVKLQVIAPRGVDGRAMPDTAVVQRRGRG